MNKITHLHRATVNKSAVQFLGGLGGSVRLAEDDRSNTTADTVLVVGNSDPLDRADCLCEIVLKCRD